MRFPLTDQLRSEADEFGLRSACVHCFFYVGDRCALEWPMGDQRRWPLDAADDSGRRPDEVAFCKEFELA